MKALVAAFNQEKDLVGAFSVIVQLHRLIVYSTNYLAVEEKCPESRCTFTTDRSLDNQEQADAVLFHMPNFHWDRSQITVTRTM